ncbi:MAG TPA: fasciclin domain-containing protein [Gemmatimonadaceae bacterium]
METRLAFIALLLAVWCCAPTDTPGAAGAQVSTSGQAGVADDESMKTIARIAAESGDHSTLVTALKAVNYVDPLANPGPFTVFAPVNAAFDKLPSGTVETLLKPESASQLRTILLHHVTTSAFELGDLTNGMEVGMVDGGPVTIQREGDSVRVGGAKVLASVRASNGWVHVIDGVLLPATK